MHVLQGFHQLTLECDTSIKPIRLRPFGPFTRQVQLNVLCDGVGARLASGSILRFNRHHIWIKSTNFCFHYYSTLSHVFLLQCDFLQLNLLLMFHADINHKPGQVCVCVSVCARVCVPWACTTRTKGCINSWTLALWSPETRLLADFSVGSKSLN